MKTYQAKSVFRIDSGRVVLSDAQAKRRLRSQCVEAGKPRGSYLVLSPFDFKVGEQFGWDGTPPKGATSPVSEITA